MQVLLDDYGFAEAGWHRNTTIGDTYIPYTDEVVTPGLNALVEEGIDMDRTYVYKCCSQCLATAHALPTEGLLERTLVGGRKTTHR